MQVKLSEKHQQQNYAQEAEEILRRCVHCGFCNATCPTFQILGDELDGPRGRIYLIKNILEGEQPTIASRNHLDRCLSCQSCETTCPSGVQYSRLLETGRQIHHQALSRPLKERWLRLLLRKLLLHPALFKKLLILGHGVSFMLPAKLRTKIPPLGSATATNKKSNTIEKHPRTLIMLRGCAQQISAPEINLIARDIFNQLGFNVIESDLDKCCGALSQHNDATEEARMLARKNIDAWWPLLQQGAENIVITASGCATMVSDYSHLLANDKNYADKAQRITELCRDPVEIIEQFSDQIRRKSDVSSHISYHAPCTQQHGLALQGRVEAVLTKAGFALSKQDIGHLCCGSAGSYSILQPVLSSQLLLNKINDLTKENADLIATANIGCLLHMQGGTDTPVKHWLQLIAVDS